MVVAVLGITSSLGFLSDLELLRDIASRRARFVSLFCFVMINLYRAYVLPHFQYCSPLLLGISPTLNNKLELANDYALRTILNLGRLVSYDVRLSITSMSSLEQRRIQQSLIVFFSKL